MTVAETKVKVTMSKEAKAALTPPKPEPETPFTIEKMPPGRFGAHFFRISREGSGNIPESLKGLYTDVRNAQIAIDNYVGSKNK